MFSRFSLWLSTCLILFLLPVSTPQAQDLKETLTQSVKLIQDQMPEGEAFAFLDFLVQSDIPPAMIAQTLYVQQHFDKAAWFFNVDAQINPGHDESISNLAALLVELHLDNPDHYPASSLEVALHLAREAVLRLPGRAGAHNALSRAALNLAATGSDRQNMLIEALKAAERATELEPQEPLYWTNLARIHKAMGNDTEFKRALTKAGEINPTAPAYIFTTVEFDQPLLSPSSEGGTSERSCEINFRCGEICPKSIIGGVKRVTCELENDTAVKLCKAGQPFPTSYDCEEELPNFGVRLPGLNDGFSVCIPIVCLHVSTNSEGGINVKFEAGVNFGALNASIKGKGRFTPSNGASFSEFGGVVRINLAKNSPVGKAAARHDQAPVQVKVEATNNANPTLSAEAYNRGLISF